MRMSAKGEYGVRAMVLLALNYSKGPLSLPKIAQKENISFYFLEQIFLELRRAGLIDSVRGARGGYVLSKPPAEIPISHIIRTLEGPIAPVECLLNDEEDHACGRHEQCLARGVWEKLRDSMQEVLDDVTLGDLIAKKLPQNAGKEDYKDEKNLHG